MQIKKLSEVCDFQNGFAFKSSKFKSEGSPILRISNIQNNVISTKNLVYFDRSDYMENFDRYKVSKDDILIAMSGATTGKLGINSTDDIYYLNQRVGKFAPKKDLVRKYLYYFLITKTEESLKIAAGAAQPNLSTEQIKDFKIPIPSLIEQQDIVEKLDFAFDAIEKAKANIEKNIENAKELFQSKLNAIFSQKGEGWEEKTLNEISKNLDSKRIPITKNVRTEGAIPYYGASGIVDYVEDFIFDGSYLLISEDGANLLARTYPIAFSVDGKFWVNNHAHILEFKDFVTQKFVEYYLNSIKLDDYVTGMAQPKLSQTSLHKIFIPIPINSIKEQEKIVAKLDLLSEQTNLLQEKYKQKLANLEELKKSILEKAFEGELI